MFPPRLSPEERLWEDLKQRTQEAESEQGESEYFTLPDEVDGRGVLWNYPRDRTGRRLVLLIAFLIPVLYFVMDLQVHQKAQERKEQLELDYPGFLWKLTMLLGAGMPIRAALLKMASAYERQKEKSRKRYAYEELCSTCREMQSGVAEAEAYERFGKRCGLRSYIKLGALLAQNMKKGSRGLAGILQKEASISMDERRSLARRQGERAGTKLLFPMLMMLGVVLLILMVPAFLSLN